jgi:methenyltetrahydrofolate cyclohydrolase
LSIKDQTLADFCSQLGAGTFAPGGGAAAAVTGALGASLVGMLAGLTVGRQKYSSVHEEMADLQAKTSQAAEALLACANADMAAFTQVMAAYALPKATDADRAARADALQRGYRAATEVPLRVMSHAVSVMRMALGAVQRGNPNAQSDGYVGFLNAGAAFDGGLWSVATNLPHLSDAYRSEVVERVRHLRRERSEIAAAVQAAMPQSIAEVLQELE